MKPTVLVLSCEHAVNHVPDEYQHLFASNPKALTTHHAVDMGAREITQYLHDKLGTPSIFGTVSRLLIDCNRGLHHHRCFSRFSKQLMSEEQQYLIDNHYVPFRNQVHELIKNEIAQNNQVLHLSIHSFAPTRLGIRRNAGLGILYDPRRHGEKEVARLWHALMLQHKPVYRVRMNYPFLGSHDNFSSELRRNYTEHDYLGLELFCNQALVQNPESSTKIMHVIAHSLQELLEML